MYLMHKNNIVAKIMLYENTPIGVTEIYIPELLPIGMHGDLDFADRNIATWHSGRTIPFGRVNIKEIQTKLGNVETLTMQSMGLSLTDCYWYVNEDMINMYHWEDINFYDNGFIADLLLLKHNLLDQTHRCPDYTTNGMLEKAWFCENGVAYLVKNGIFPGVNTEPTLAANEVVASRIASRLGINCVEYEKIIIGNETFCCCPCFSEKNEDIVTAQMIQEQLNTRDTFKVQEYIRDIGFGEDLDKMKTLHILIHNHDGHLGNFGVILDADTRDFKRFTPLYDNGSSLNWHNSSIGSNNMRPFESNPKMYAATIETFVALPKLSELEYIVQEVYADFGISNKQMQVALTELRHGYEIIENRMLELELEFAEPDMGE